MAPFVVYWLGVAFVVVVAATITVAILIVYAALRYIFSNKYCRFWSTEIVGKMRITFVFKIMREVVIETDCAFILTQLVKWWVHSIIVFVVDDLVLSVVLRQVGATYPGDGTCSYWSFIFIWSSDGCSFPVHFVVGLMMTTDDAVDTLTLTGSLLLLIQILRLCVGLLLAWFAQICWLLSGSLTLVPIWIHLMNMVSRSDLRVQGWHCDVGSGVPAVVAL